jgi:hypothetical protein
MHVRHVPHSLKPSATQVIQKLPDSAPGQPTTMVCVSGFGLLLWLWSYIYYLQAALAAPGLYLRH